MFKTIPPAGTKISFKEIFFSLSAVFSKTQAGEEFKLKLGEYFQARDFFLVSSGRAALSLILKTLKKKSVRDEVIIPAYTCFSVPSAVAKAGLKLKLCDVSLETLDLDPKKLSRLIDENTLAVLPVYHFGLAHDISEIINLCRKNKVFVIEDVAQGMGAKFGGRHLGTSGDLAFFSLGRGKNITTMEGGILLCQDEELSSLLKQELLNFERTSGFGFFLKSFFYKIFIHPSLFWIPEKVPSLELGQSKFSLDFKLLSLSEYQSKLGSYLLRRLEEINRIRIRNAQYLVSALKHSDKIVFLASPEEAFSVYLRLPILFRDGAEREKVFLALKKEGLGASRMYPTSLEKIAGIKNYLATGSADLFNSQLLEKILLTLPTHQFLKEKDLNKMVKLFEKNFKE